jgi:hypothetical protein
LITTRVAIVKAPNRAPREALNFFADLPLDNAMRHAYFESGANTYCWLALTESA